MSTPSPEDIFALGDEGDLPDAIPAATLVIFRDGTDGAPELLMVERAKKMVFAAGAMVFPGGRIDPGDHELAAALGHPSVEDDWEGAAKVGAIRETIEETGVPVGLNPLPSTAALARMRDALHAGTPFGAVLAEAGVALELDRLVPFARWRPAHRNMRIFDTRFFVARLPADAPQASVDETENVRLAWAGAQAVLDDADAGMLSIIYPTRRNLERLAQFATYDDAEAHARATPIRVVTPWPETRDGVAHLCIPEDLGYPVTSEMLDSAKRG